MRIYHIFVRSVVKFSKHSCDSAGTCNKGKHKKPAVSMKDFVYKRMQLRIEQSKQVTSMHFQKMKVDRDGNYLPEPPALQGTSRQVYLSSKVGRGSQKGKEVYLAGQR